MWPWSTTCHLSFGLFISFFNLIGQKSKIYWRMHKANKNVAWSSTFLWTIFQHGLTFFLMIQLVMSMLKGRKLYWSGWKMTFRHNFRQLPAKQNNKILWKLKKTPLCPFLLTLRQTKTNTQIPRKVGYRRGYRKMHRQAWI